MFCFGLAILVFYYERNICPDRFASELNREAPVWKLKKFATAEAPLRNWRASDAPLIAIVAQAASKIVLSYASYHYSQHLNVFQLSVFVRAISTKFIFPIVDSVDIKNCNRVSSMTLCFKLYTVLCPM